MSVRVVANAEFSALCAALRRGDVAAPLIADAIRVLAWANRAAYGLTYGEAAEEAPSVHACPWWEEEREREKWPSVAAWARNLLYNCVSNGGTDFAPAPASTLVRAAAASADAASARGLREAQNPGATS